MASWVKRSARRASVRESTSVGTNSEQAPSPPSRPEAPAVHRSCSVRAPTPSGVMAPSPVTTTSRTMTQARAAMRSSTSPTVLLFFMSSAAIVTPYLSSTIWASSARSSESTSSDSKSASRLIASGSAPKVSSASKTVVSISVVVAGMSVSSSFRCVSRGVRRCGDPVTRGLRRVVLADLDEHGAGGEAGAERGQQQAAAVGHAALAAGLVQRERDRCGAGVADLADRVDDAGRVEAEALGERERDARVGLVGDHEVDVGDVDARCAQHVQAAALHRGDRALEDDLAVHAHQALVVVDDQRAVDVALGAQTEWPRRSGPPGESTAAPA